jgi:hypothetical protein
VNDESRTMWWKMQWMQLRLTDAACVQKSHRNGSLPMAFGGIKSGFLGVADGFLHFAAKHAVKHVK